MSKIRKITPKRIQKIRGGKDPSLILEKFMEARGFSPEDYLQKRTADIAQWLIPLGNEEDLEITLEGLTRSSQSTLYMGLNIYAVPLSNTQKVLAAALQVADTLIGAKLSLVNYDIVLSNTTYADSLSVEDVDYNFELLLRQKSTVKDALNEELS